MGIKIVDYVEKKDWNEFVYRNKYGNIFQTFEISEVYKKSKDSEPLMLAAINENTDEILAGMLIRKRKEKVGFLSSFSSHATIRGGPIFEDNEHGIDAVVQLLKYYDKRMKKEALYTRIYPVYDVPQIKLCLEEYGYEYGGWNNILIDLSKPVDEIWRELKKYRRQGVNRSKRRGVEIEGINDRKLIPVFYNLLLETHKYHESSMHTTLEDLNYFEAAFDIFVPKKMAKFFMAKHEGRYIAAILLLRYKGIVHEWYAGSSRKREDLLVYPNDLLVWHTIEWGCNNGFHTYDFLGAGDPDMPSSLLKFKKQFGGILVNYGRYIKVHSPKKMWLSKKAFRVYKKYKLWEESK
jgi:hypothetical protein